MANPGRARSKTMHLAERTCVSHPPDWVQGLYQLIRNHHGFRIFSLSVHHLIRHGDWHSRIVRAFGRFVLPKRSDYQKTVAPFGFTLLHRAIRFVFGRLVDSSRHYRPLSRSKLPFALGVFVAAANANGLNVTSSSDPLNRLTNAAYSDGSRESYSYDAAGNRFSRITLASTNSMDAQAPTIPSGLVIFTNANGALQARWNRSFDQYSGAAGYTLMLNGQQFSNAPTATTLLTGLTANAYYCLTVAAFDHAGNSSLPSIPICFRIPPVNLSGNPKVAINIYPSASPNTSSTSRPAWRTNAMEFLQSGIRLAANRSQPTNFVVSRVLEVGDLLVSTNPVALWRGELNPPSPFDNERGCYMFFCVTIASQIPFNLDGFQWRLQGSDPDLGLFYAGRLTNSTYFAQRVGIWYGPDGIKGTADDVRIESGTGTQLVNELYYTGVASSFNGNDAAQIESVKSLLAPDMPYTIRCDYTLYDTNSQPFALAFNSLSTDSNRVDKMLIAACPTNLLGFGAIPVGGLATQNCVLSNACDSPIFVSSVACPFGFSCHWPGGWLTPRTTTNVSVVFQPMIANSYGGRIQFNSDATAGSDTIAVSGTGVETGNSPTALATIYPTPAPNSISPSHRYHRTAAVTYLRYGTGLSYDRSSPKNYTLPSIAEIGDVLTSTNPVALWRAALNPLPPFDKERGGYLRFGLRVISSKPFNLNGVSWNHRASATNYFVYTGTLTNLSYNLSITGLWYGPDGVNGTADDVWRTSGAGDGLINEFYYNGVANSYFGNSPSQIQSVRNIIISNAPFYLNCTYTISDTNGAQIAAASTTIPIIESIQELTPRMFAHDLQAGQLFGFDIAGSPAAPYAIWASTNLIDWHLITNFVLKDWSVPWVDPETLKFQQRFYKARTAF